MERASFSISEIKACDCPTVVTLKTSQKIETKIGKKSSTLTSRGRPKEGWPKVVPSFPCFVIRFWVWSWKNSWSWVWLDLFVSIWLYLYAEKAEHSCFSQSQIGKLFVSLTVNQFSLSGQIDSNWEFPFSFRSDCSIGKQSLIDWTINQWAHEVASLRELFIIVYHLLEKKVVLSLFPHFNLFLTVTW